MANKTAQIVFILVTLSLVGLGAYKLYQYKQQSNDGDLATKFTNAADDVYESLKNIEQDINDMDVSALAKHGKELLKWGVPTIVGTYIVTLAVYAIHRQLISEPAAKDAYDTWECKKAEKNAWLYEHLYRYYVDGQHQEIKDPMPGRFKLTFCTIVRTVCRGSLSLVLDDKDIGATSFDAEQAAKDHSDEIKKAKTWTAVKQAEAEQAEAGQAGGGGAGGRRRSRRRRSCLFRRSGRRRSRRSGLFRRRRLRLM